MKIKNIKISNLLSFPYVPNLGNHKGITFDTDGKNNINILVGANGSGKSSFLEIINQSFKGIMKDFAHEQKTKNAILQNDIPLQNIKKHKQSINKKSQVIMKLTLGEHDYDNLGCICKYNKIINNIIKTYSTIDVQFPKIDSTKIRAIKDIEIKITYNEKNKTMDIEQKNLSEREKFILLYIQYFELIQICMLIYNQESNREKTFYPLYNTFTILGSYRNFFSTDQLDKIAKFPREWSKYITLQDTKTYYSTSIGYYLFIEKIQKEKDIYTSTIYQNVNTIVEKFLGLSLQIHQENKKYTLGVTNKYNDYYKLDELNSGEQSLLMILLSVFGYDLQDGLMIIDEPEIHLHPQFQKKLIEIIHILGEKLGMQFILATHSPLMINESNIDHVYRFAYHNGGTKITYPSIASTRKDEAQLIHMLKFGNIAKIFFVDKIIMVEGETDAYFFNFIFSYFQKKGLLSPNLVTFEILNINGKGSYIQRKKFLNKYDIDTYFIGDRDNVIDNRILPSEEFNKYRQQIHTLPKWERKKHKYYTNIISIIKNNYLKEYKEINKDIENLYKKDIYILKQGDLEYYMGIKDKGLEETIHFCHVRFSNWLRQNRTQKKLGELLQIFQKIFE